MFGGLVLIPNIGVRQCMYDVTMIIIVYVRPFQSNQYERIIRVSLRAFSFKYESVWYAQKRYPRVKRMLIVLVIL